MAGEVLITISKDEAERARLRSEEKYQLDTQSKMTYARQEGIQQGIRQGMQQGMQQGKQEIIDLLKNGKSPDEIIRDYSD